jgi:asparagine synthase (glutamine-hydrolysing)
VCGISGIIVEKTIDYRELQAMSNVLKHRGPDDEGYVFINSSSGKYEERSGQDTMLGVNKSLISERLTDGFDIGLSSRRLSIIDLSPGGHQPKATQDGQLWIVYNGEIYNYIELRSQLQALGHTFRTGTDTEVLLEAFKEWGQDCLSRMNGMWGFCIWDGKKKQLFCARDRFGVKPFYYYFDGKIFIFASEIKAILEYPKVKREPNLKVVYDFLVFSQLDISEDTFFKGIQQLLPGHYMILNQTTMELTIKKYWHLPYSQDLGDFSNDNGLIVERFLDLFHDAVRLRLRADVPVGTCLSGGLDSSSIVYIMNRMIKEEDGINKNVIGERQKTFTSAFDDVRFDEREYVREILSITGAKEYFVFPKGSTMWEELTKLTWHQDEPFASTSIYAQWNVMRLAHENGVKVLLDGQGGDELLAGYRPYFGVWLTNLFLTGRVYRFWKEIKGILFNTDLKLRDILRLLGQAVYTDLPLGIRRDIREKNRLSLKVLSKDFKHTFNEQRGGLENGRKRSNLQRVLFDDISKFNLPPLLRYEDRNSMAFSIETRLPFLDYRLVEFVFSLPASEKIRNGQSKYLLRNAMKGFLPVSILQRKDKKGFVTPHMQWMREGKERLLSLFSDKDYRSGDFIDQKKVLKLIEDSLGQTTIIGMELWRLISFEFWMKTFQI